MSEPYCVSNIVLADTVIHQRAKSVTPNTEVHLPQLILRMHTQRQNVLP